MLIHTPYSLFSLISRHFALTSAKRYVSANSYILWYLFRFPLHLYNISCEQYYRLHMHGLRKHIHRSPPHQLIPLLAQHFQISRQRRGIAAHIHDPLRRHLHDRIEQRRVAAFSRRVHHDHVCSRAAAAGSSS